MEGCEDIFAETYNVPIYQEQLMFVSKKVAGFNDNQADSITRKILGKKKVALMPMLKRCHIYGKKNCEGPEGWETNDDLPWYDPKGKYGDEIPGGISRGYTKEQILHYFDEISEFAKYSFNRAHTACYGYLAILTAWLKVYYPAQFMSALLSIFNSEEEKRKRYVRVCEKQLKISLRVPDINISGSDFTPNGKEILYGLGSVKGCGAASIPAIIEEREANGPYQSIQDAVNRLPKSVFKKNVAEALIKCGAFDFEDSNRYRLLNHLYDIRDDRKMPRYPENEFCRQTIIEFEEQTLGVPLTYKPWWDTIKENESVDKVEAIMVNSRTQNDRRGRTMMFCTVNMNDCNVDCVIFSSVYQKTALFLEREHFVLTGKKDEKGKLIVSGVRPV